MDEDTVIAVDHVSKKYCKVLRQSMFYGLQDIGRNMCGLSSRSEKLRKSEFWAVDDVSFEVKKGESVGLVGPNGSGKSTLLKLLNGIFWPDKGKITVKGNVGALIEVGAGFHPLLTGRENIYINAAIMGMTKKQVDEKFDDIIKFAEIGDFIDAPVKSYSSGMFVRLGFAVAVHSEPDILLVDEVLAVGDAVFRNKCYRKMNEIKESKSTSIIYVSHDLFTVEKFCDTGVLLFKGKSQPKNEIHTVISDYQAMINEWMQNQSGNGASSDALYCTKTIELRAVTFLGKTGFEQAQFDFNDTLRVRIDFEAQETVYRPVFQVSLWTFDGQLISVFGPHFENLKIPKVEKGSGFVEFEIPNLPLLANRYCLKISVFDETRTNYLDWWDYQVHPELSFMVLPNSVSTMMGQYCPPCYFESKWTVNGQKIS